MSTWPRVGCEYVASNRSSTLLPAPFGPSSAHSSPARTENVICSRSSRPAAHHVNSAGRQHGPAVDGGLGQRRILLAAVGPTRFVVPRSYAMLAPPGLAAPRHPPPGGPSPRASAAGPGRLGTRLQPSHLHRPIP